MRHEQFYLSVYLSPLSVYLSIRAIVTVIIILKRIATKMTLFRSSFDGASEIFCILKFVLFIYKYLREKNC